MRYILASLLLIVGMLGICLTCAWAVDDVIEETDTLLAAAIEMQQRGRKPDAIHLVQAASNKWKANETFFGMVLRHDEIDGVIGEFARLESYAHTQDEDDFLSNCAALRADLTHIREMEWPYLGNVF